MDLLLMDTFKFVSFENGGARKHLGLFSLSVNPTAVLKKGMKMLSAIATWEGMTDQQKCRIGDKC